MTLDFIVDPRSCAAAHFEAGQSVWYLDRSGGLIEATIGAIDRSIRPWAYSVYLAGAVASRETEADRLRPVSGSETWSTPELRQRPSALHAPCPTPSCQGHLSENALQVSMALLTEPEHMQYSIQASCLQLTVVLICPLGLVPAGASGLSSPEAVQPLAAPYNSLLY